VTQFCGTDPYAFNHANFVFDYIGYIYRLKNSSVVLLGKCPSFLYSAPDVKRLNYFKIKSLCLECTNVWDTVI
jgi:hypothetical protein